MLAKKPIGATLVVAVVAMMAAAFSTSASAAVCTKFILCPGSEATQQIRDDLAEGPEGGGYGADMLAVNTKAEVRLNLRAGGTVVAQQSLGAKGYSSFGLKLHADSTTGCEAGKEAATGWVTFADIADAMENMNKIQSPAYAGISPGGFGAWPLTIRSGKCATNPGKVIVENVHLYFPVLGATAVGTITGVYQQPEAGSCPGGGVKLDVAQPGITVSGGLSAELDNGAGGNAYLCFVGADNILYPKVAPEWKELQGSIWQD